MSELKSRNIYLGPLLTSSSMQNWPPFQSCDIWLRYLHFFVIIITYQHFRNFADTISVSEVQKFPNYCENERTGYGLPLQIHNRINVLVELYLGHVT